MSIDELIVILQNKINNLTNQRELARQQGDLAQLDLFEIQIEETNLALNKLKQ